MIFRVTCSRARISYEAEIDEKSAVETWCLFEREVADGLTLQDAVGLVHEARKEAASMAARQAGDAQSRVGSASAAHPRMGTWSSNVGDAERS